MSMYMDVGLPNDGFRRQAERDFLKQHASQYSGGSVLEIGAWKGASTIALCETGNHVTSVDLWENGDVFDEFVENTKQFVNLTFFKGTSKQFFQQNNQLFDLIFIDGDHSRDCFYHDLMIGLSRLKSHGTLVCHDFSVGHSWIVAGVQKLGQHLAVVPVSCFYMAALAGITHKSLSPVAKYDVLHAIRYAGTANLVVNSNIRSYANKLHAQTLSTEMVQYVKEMTDSVL